MIDRYKYLHLDDCNKYTIDNICKHLSLTVLETEKSKTAVPNLFGTRDQFPGRHFFHGWGLAGDGSGSNTSDGERWGAADAVSLARPPLTSCRAARFLTGNRQVPAHGPGGWGPLV